MRISLGFMIRLKGRSTNLIIRREGNMDWRRSYRIKRKGWRRSLCNHYRHWKNVRSGLRRIFLGRTHPMLITGKKLNKRRLILIVMMIFMIGLCKTRKIQINHSKVLKSILKKLKFFNLQSKIYGS